MSEHRIVSITFEGDVVNMQYLTATDVRVNGYVGLAHQIQLSMEHPDYAEDALLLERQAQRMLRNALEDWSESEPWTPDDDSDDEEMGSRNRPAEEDR